MTKNQHEIQYWEDNLKFYEKCLEKLRQPDGGFRMFDMDIVDRLYLSIDYCREELEDLKEEK